MTTKLATLLAALLLSTGLVACGGADVSGSVDDENADLANNGEPMDWVTAAKDATTQFLGHPRLVQVEGASNSKGVYTWTFTFYGDVMGYARVEASPKGAKVVGHGHMIDAPMGAATIETTKVKVGVSDLLSLATKDGVKGKCSHIELSEAVTAKPAPHWLATFGKTIYAVNAATGAKE